MEMRILAPIPPECPANFPRGSKRVAVSKKGVEKRGMHHDARYYNDSVDAKEVRSCLSTFFRYEMIKILLQT